MHLVKRYTDAGVFSTYIDFWRLLKDLKASRGAFELRLADVLEQRVGNQLVAQIRMEAELNETN